MAKHEALVSLSVEASADLSASQFRFMELDANGRLALVNASTDVSIGVLQNKPLALGQPGEVAISGRVKIVAGAAVAINAEIMSDTVGRAITAATATNRVHGLAMTAAANAGELIEVLLLLNNRVL